MKALAIDGAVSKLTISAKNDDKTCTLILDIGMKQSENIVSAIELVLNKVELKATELEYLALSNGPGSFTGLRLAISALKAIQLASGAALYGISSLKIYSYEFKDFGLPVLSGIDANKGCWYANLTDFTESGSKPGTNCNVGAGAATNLCSKEVLCDGDHPVEKVLTAVQNYNKLIVCGPDSEKLAALIKDKLPAVKTLTPKVKIIPTDALFAILEEKIAAGEPPLKDFDGPEYLRASEAEQKLTENK
ncbi:MAG: tRNA (adenosine(37)-N6)-threonylcarbamoyltransferase complex dimerization subunit type 1 TsaB [Treponema sp.]|nr:tRNA (adenosine(37)-N6)-threonylcarbamoyltransferase complex dimerization subunit type 1 TsaB [Treponema sp.]